MEGEEEGCREGEEEGLEEGWLEGCIEGLEEGWLEGEEEGLSDGELVGELVGEGVVEVTPPTARATRTKRKSFILVVLETGCQLLKVFLCVSETKNVVASSLSLSVEVCALIL